MLMRNCQPTAHLSISAMPIFHMRNITKYILIVTIYCMLIIDPVALPCRTTLYVMNVYSLNDKYLDKVLFVHMNVLFISCYYCHAFKKLCFLTVCINCLGKDMTRQISFCFKGVVFHLLNLKLDLLLGNYENRRLICCN